MRKTALDNVISKLALAADNTDPTVDADIPPAHAGQASPAPKLEIEGYIVTFLTRKSNPSIKYEFDTGKPTTYTKDNILQFTYGQGDNFQWNSLVCLFTAGGAKGAYVTDLTNDGRQGSNVEIAGNTTIKNTVGFIDAVKAQGLDFPFMQHGQMMDYKKLCMNMTYFVDVSDDAGKLDNSKAEKYKGQSALSMHSKVGTGVDAQAIHGMTMSAFDDNYDNKFYRLLGNGELYKVDGTLDAKSTGEINKIMKGTAPTAPSPSSAPSTGSATAPGAEVFKAQGTGKGEPGLGKKADTTDKEQCMNVDAQDSSGTQAPVDTNKVNDSTKAVEKLNETLAKTQEIIGGKSASFMRSVRSLMLKSSEI